MSFVCEKLSVVFSFIRLLKTSARTCSAKQYFCTVVKNMTLVNDLYSYFSVLLTEALSIVQILRAPVHKWRHPTEGRGVNDFLTTIQYCSLCAKLSNKGRVMTSSMVKTWNTSSTKRKFVIAGKVCGCKNVYFCGKFRSLKHNLDI